MDRYLAEAVSQTPTSVAMSEEKRIGPKGPSTVVSPEHQVHQSSRRMTREGDRQDARIREIVRQELEKWFEGQR